MNILMRLALPVTTVTAAWPPSAPMPVHSHPRVAYRSGVCSKLDQPKKMPGVNVLFDSASLMQQLRDLDAKSPGEVTFSITHSDPPDAHIMDGAPVNDMNASILAVELAALHPDKPDWPYTFRVRVKHGPSNEVKIERSELCVPVPTASAATINPPRTTFAVSKNSPRGAVATPNSPPALRYRVSAAGQVVEVEISKSDNSVTSQELKTQLLKTSYRPATLDGVPVEVWFDGTKAELTH